MLRGAGPLGVARSGGTEVSVLLTRLYAPSGDFADLLTRQEPAIGRRSVNRFSGLWLHPCIGDCGDNGRTNLERRPSGWSRRRGAEPVHGLLAGLRSSLALHRRWWPLGSLGELGTRRAGEPSGCPKAMPEAERYTLVVRARSERHHPRPWGWEICRDGDPLPARLREEGLKTEHTATMAGRVALRDFLQGLAEEEGRF
jgi:hypothetical protein